MKKTMLSFLLGISILTVCGQDLSINNLPGNDIREKSDYFYARLSRNRIHSNVLGGSRVMQVLPVN